MTTSTEEGTERPGEGETREDFETAQRRLFEEVGLRAQSRFVDLERPHVRTHVFESGPQRGGPPIVFVHGTALFGASLSPLSAYFDDARTIAFDRPGYGLSDAFVYTEENIRRTVVDTLSGVLDELGLERVDIVGHSMGGHTGIRFALAHPHRVRRLILVGAVPAFPGTRPPIQLRLLTVPLLNRLIRRMQRPDEEGVLDIADIFNERETIRRYPALIRAIAAHERDAGSSEAGFSEFNALLSVRGWHPSVRIREDELRSLRPPTTIIWGEHDPLGEPDDVRDGVGLIPDARLETVESGHIPFLAHPERCVQIIREARATV